MKAIKEIVRKYYKYVDTAWTQPTLSANGTMGGDSFACTATAYQSYFDPYKAFDGITTYETQNAWLPGTTTEPQSFIFYNPIPLKVTNLAITNFWHRNNPVYIIKNCTIFASNDNSNWVQLTTYTNTNTTGGSTWNIDLSSNTNYYKYYKIRIDSSISQEAGIGELTITATQGIITESTSLDYDFYKDVDVYKVPKIDDTYYGVSKQ